jgi:transcription elongation factor GreA
VAGLSFNYLCSLLTASFSATLFVYTICCANTGKWEFMGETSFLTREGYIKLQEELKYLRTVRRPQVAEHIRIAKEDGDLSENAGYDAAKNEQSFVEGRIMTVESILKNATIIESSGNNGVVTLGCKVTVQEDGYGPEKYHLVGSPEADPSNGRISNESPLGRTLMGRSVDDKVEVNTPGGIVTFTILEIE